jgi:hypothetical protein
MCVSLLSIDFDQSMVIMLLYQDMFHTKHFFAEFIVQTVIRNFSSIIFMFQYT